MLDFIIRMDKTPKWVTVRYIVLFFSDLLLHHINRRAAMKQYRKSVLVLKRTRCSWHGNREEETIIAILETKLKKVFVLDTETDFMLWPRKGVGGN